jgi:DNA-binding beta-propeller fold protein YncE
MQIRRLTRREIIRSTGVLVLLVGMLALVGCETGDRQAGAGDLENRAFTFTNAAVFGLTGQAVTLTFGDFDADGNPNRGPVTLQVAASGGRASGTATIGSLDLTFSQSNNLQEIPAGTKFFLDLTVIVDGSIVLTNRSTSVSSASEVPNAIPTTNVAFVLTTDFATGSYSVVDLASRNTFNDIVLGGVHSDASARFFNGLVYVINRFGADNIQIIDPQQGFTTIAQESVGNGSNPQDIAVVSSSKAYVSRLASAQLLIVDPITLAQIGTLDLSDLTKPNDLDGVPELFRMLVHNGLVYLLLQHLDFSGGSIPTKAAPGEVVVIDPATDTITAVIALQGTNPNTDLQYSPDLDRILVGSAGDFLVPDGGIEAIDPATNTVDAGFVIDEAAIGGDITHFEIVSATKGFAIITDATFANLLVTFDPSSGQKLATVVGPLNVFMPHFAINRRQELYLAVNDVTTPTPGIQIIDTVQDTPLTTEPLSVGQLPPFYVLFIEE